MNNEKMKDVITGAGLYVRVHAYSPTLGFEFCTGKVTKYSPSKYIQGTELPNH